MKKAERQHLQRLAELGCCAGVPRGTWCGSPAEIHHIRTGQGLKRASHFEAIPLCPEHHRIGGYGTAFHAGARAWQEAHGSELEHLEMVRKMTEKSE
jgi:hypothetical protein